MKVLIVFNHPAPYKVSIFNELAKYVDLTVIFERTKAKDRPDDFYINNNYNFNVIFLKDGYIGNEGSLSCGVKKYIKEHFREYDHIVMNGYSHVAEIKAINYLHRHHIRFSLLINGGIARNKEFFLKRRYKSKLISYADFYMSPSLNSDDYLTFYRANKDRIYRYPYSNLSEKELFKPLLDKSELRKELGLPLDKKIYINASQFIERKNNMQLLSLFKDRDDFLLLIGDGKELDKYQAFIKDNNMSNVLIVPFQKKDRLFKYLQASDVFISLAKWDIFGHTTVEALANHLPVIASKNINSALEYVKDGYNGYVVDLENDQSIRDAIDNSKNINPKNCTESIKNNTFENCGKVLYDILAKENM